MKGGRFKALEEPEATITVCVLGEVSGKYQFFVRLQIGRLDGHSRVVYVVQMMNFASFNQIIIVSGRDCQIGEGTILSV